MNYKRSLARMTGNYRTLDKKVLSMKKSWDDVSKLLEGTGKGKRKKVETKKSETKKSDGKA